MTSLAKLSLTGVELLLLEIEFRFGFGFGFGICGGLKPSDGFDGFRSEDGVDLPDNEGVGRKLG